MPTTENESSTTVLSKSHLPDFHEQTLQHYHVRQRSSFLRTPIRITRLNQ